MRNITLKEITCITFYLVVFSTPIAYAYIDPGTGSLIWQFILAAFFGMLFYVRKIKRIFLNFFNKKDNHDAN